jgi:APA family basic amino acid/polyamine antiporter
MSVHESTSGPGSTSGGGRATERTMGLTGAVAVGTGAIVGGGIFVLSGSMVAQAGPSALAALGLNGVLALLTAMSFAELSTAFPENGGEYAFARRILSVRSAFATGWLIWFAYAVAAALYALGFAAYLLLAIDTLFGTSMQSVPVATKGMGLSVAALVTGALARWGPRGGVVANVGKILVFGVVIVGGLAALSTRPTDAVASLVPFAPGGGMGILAAMGLSFIILQGFGNIVAVAGSIRNPSRTVPRALFISLAIAMCLYGPMVFLTVTVGVPEGVQPQALALSDVEGFFARAVRTWMGDVGWWFVVVAALLAMLSALQANLLAAAGVGQAMAADRTLPRAMAEVHARWRTPSVALGVGLVLASFVLLLLPDPSAAGAAASLIFLLCFSLVHGLAWLARRRLPREAEGFRSPMYPLVPWVGGVACAGVALFQMVLVPDAGWMTAAWLVLGAFLYFGFLGDRAEAMDAAFASFDPSVHRSRGRTTTVLVPIAAPSSAASLAALGGLLAPKEAGRVSLLHVVESRVGTTDDVREALARSHDALDRAIAEVHGAGRDVSLALTVAPDAFPVIRRVAGEQGAQCVLLGLPRSATALASARVNALLSDLACDVALLCAGQGVEPNGWRSVLVPIGGSTDHDALRARVLGALVRQGARDFHFVRILDETASDASVRIAAARLQRLFEDEVRGQGSCRVIRSANPARTIAESANGCDVVLLGATRVRRGAWVLSDLLLEVVERAPCAVLVLSRRGSPEGRVRRERRGSDEYQKSDS